MTAPEPNSDASLALSNRLQQSVASGQLAVALQSAVGYPVTVAADGQNDVFLGRATLELDSSVTSLSAGQADISCRLVRCCSMLKYCVMICCLCHYSCTMHIHTDWLANVSPHVC